MTNLEWVALALLSHKSGHDVKGAKSRTGQFAYDPKQPGKNLVQLEGVPADFSPTRTGGEDVFSHDGTPYGVFNMYGFYWEVVTGISMHSDGNIAYTAGEPNKPWNDPFIDEMYPTMQGGSNTIHGRWCSSGIHMQDENGRVVFGEGGVTNNFNCKTLGMKNVDFRFGSDKLKVMRQIGTVPPSTDTREYIVQKVIDDITGYNPITRGSRMGDGTGFESLFSVDVRRHGLEALASCDTFRLAYVSV